MRQHSEQGRADALLPPRDYPSNDVTDLAIALAIQDPHRNDLGFPCYPNHAPDDRRRNMSPMPVAIGAIFIIVHEVIPVNSLTISKSIV